MTIDEIHLALDASTLDYHITEEILNLLSVREGYWILQASNKEQGERDFIWWKCSECGQVIYSETEIDRKKNHAFCSRCGARMVEQEKRCVDCNHYGKFSLDCARCDDDCSMFEPKKEGD